MTISSSLGPGCTADRSRTGSAERGLPVGRIEIRWSALRPAPDRPCGARAPVTSRTNFVLVVRPVDEQHVLLEGWLETPAGLQNVLPRRPASCAIERDGDLLHLDVDRNGRRVLALTIEEGIEGRLRYVAARPCLARAGLAPGSCDPPVARVAAMEQDVTSA